MGKVAKYNTFKGVSTLLTIGTPIITLACTGEFFVQRSESAVSAAAMFAILISLIFCKDKLLEKIKTPAPFILCGVVLALIYMVENLMYPMKLVCWATLATTLVDEFTFRRMYKQLEKKLPKNAEDYKRFGFIFTTAKKLEETELSE
jgi:hypothetical protein